MSFTAIITSYFMYQFEDLHPKWDWHRITLGCLRCSCSFPCESKPKNISHRIYFTSFLFGSMLFGIYLVSVMMKLMTNPLYENQVNSVETIIDGSFDLAGDIFVLEHLTKQKEVNYLEYFFRARISNNFIRIISGISS